MCTTKSLGEENFFSEDLIPGKHPENGDVFTVLLQLVPGPNLWEKSFGLR